MLLGLKRNLKKLKHPQSFKIPTANSKTTPSPTKWSVKNFFPLGWALNPMGKYSGELSLMFLGIEHNHCSTQAAGTPASDCPTWHTWKVARWLFSTPPKVRGPSKLPWRVSPHTLRRHSWGHKENQMHSFPKVVKMDSDGQMGSSWCPWWWTRTAIDSRKEKNGHRSSNIIILRLVCAADCEWSC